MTLLKGEKVAEEKVFWRYGKDVLQRNLPDFACYPAWNVFTQFFLLQRNILGKNSVPYRAKKTKQTHSL